MGGAYSAIANDASAPTWNPAGLGLLERGELQATHANLFLDISEQFVSLAYPSLRWGTTAVVFRRFGVAGIEHRDDRNFLISDDLTDSETEFTVSYGRAMGPAWTLGGSVKMQRQSLAGFSDSGVGLDVGALLQPGRVLGSSSPWLNRMTFGISIRNLVEPSVRLDEESVPDPSAFRSGVAYRHPLGGHRSILAAIDFEKSKNAEGDLHVGAEVNPHPLLALRAGWNAGAFTTGSDIRWRTTAFNYLFESNDVESVHNFGVTWKFGSTVAERRLAAAQIEEERFRKRLAESFQRRQEERVNDLLERSKELLAGERFEEALGILATVEALQPDDERIAGLKSKCLFAQARGREAAGEFADAAVLYGRVLTINPEDEWARGGLERVREESDRRAARSTRIRDLFGSALDAFTAGDFVTARENLRGILDVDPDDTEAKAMLTRTETAIAVRTSNLLLQAGRFLDRGLLPEAEELLDQARALDPRAVGLPQLTARLSRAEQELAAAERKQRLAAEREKHAVATGRSAGVAKPVPESPPRAVKRPVLSQKRRKEIENLYRRGVEAMEEERGDEALNYWELVWAADPAYRNVADYLKREYLLRGLESFSQGSLEDSVHLWEKALSVDPTDEKTLGYLARAREQLTRTREILGSRP
jgi:tetratricopeptide (TPR) repeat protein